VHRHPTRQARLARACHHAAHEFVLNISLVHFVLNISLVHLGRPEARELH
jgi:hypothetical protein